MVTLLPDVHDLNEVVFSSVSKQNVKLGNLEPGTVLAVGHITQLKNKYAIYVPNEGNSKGIIKSITFNVGNATGGIEMPFKANICTKKENYKYPFTEMINDDIIVTNPKRKKTINIDISKYKIDLPENGFFIVAEILSGEFYNREKVYLHKLSWNKLPSFKVNYTKEKLNYYSMIQDYKFRNQWYVSPTFPNGKVSNFRFSAEIIPQ